MMRQAGGGEPAVPRSLISPGVGRKGSGLRHPRSLSLCARLLGPGRMKPLQPLSRAWKQMSWLYYQYLLVTALYMLEPWERTVFNSILVSIVGMALYTGYIFMPQHIMAILHYFEVVQ
ncbi:serine palmitoyltransferase small subunit A [Rhinatrema bivittatum]|uniref:serine palmitoyltransferase small subunit A n=1 Tax=Rhinatrema bivittatum TaxID=194408 RepID=UPI00112A4DD7|nr:serine palmitoyltransferase small subunit A [Rhinatrema bivittatum]